MIDVNNRDISLCFASPKLQFELYFPHQPGLTIAALLSTADLSTRWPMIVWADCAVGIWGKVVSDTTLLQAGDRVELYQPLIIDPKTARRLRSPSRVKRPRVRHRV